jgi:ATP-dependent helicase HrpB
VFDPKVLQWLDLPPEISFSHAQTLLVKLKGLDAHGRITAHGRRLLSAGVHPRLAHMILRADQMGQGRLACWLAALLGERDILSQGVDPDIRPRLEMLASLSSKKRGGKITGFNESLARTILKNAAKIERDLHIKSPGTQIELSGSVLAFAWPERVAKKRNHQTDSFLMASGSGAFFRSANSLSFFPYIVAVHLDGNPRNAGIFLAAPYSEKELEQDFKDQITTREECVWNKQTRSVQAVLKTCYGRIVVRETLVETPDPELVRAGMIQGIRETGLDILPWTQKLRHFQDRAVFLKKSGHFPGLPDLSDAALSETLAHWLGPFLDHVHSASGLKQVDLSSALTSLLTWEEQQTVHTHAPTHVVVPSGSKVLLQYQDDNGSLESPILAVRLQEMFGLTKSPAIARGKIPITLHLLSPAGRAVQITQDLESFWTTTYRAVKKDLMGRYPKHYWPEDPFSAIPTHRVKPPSVKEKPH